MIKIHRNLILNENDIVYVDHYDRKTYIHTVNSIFSSYKTTKEVVNMLPDNFIKINKALYLNRAYIKEINGLEYVLTTGEILWGAVRMAGYHKHIKKEMKGIIFIKKK